MIFIRVPTSRIYILKQLFFKTVWFFVFGIFFFPLVVLYVVSEITSKVFETWSENASKITNYFDTKSKEQVQRLHEQITPEELCKLANIPFKEKSVILPKGFDDEDSSNF